MDISEPVTLEDCRTAILLLADRGPNPASIRRLLHISRLKLGAAIERVEGGDIPADALDNLLRTAECVAFEIDTLLATFQRDPADS